MLFFCRSADKKKGTLIRRAMTVNKAEETKSNTAFSLHPNVTQTESQKISKIKMHFTSC